jgi:hypothetical protein
VRRLYIGEIEKIRNEMRKELDGYLRRNGNISGSHPLFRMIVALEGANGKKSPEKFLDEFLNAKAFPVGAETFAQHLLNYCGLKPAGS